MLIDWRDLMPRYGLAPTGIVHAGAHEGQERDAYLACGVRDVLWIEANEELLPRLRAHVEPFGQCVVHACLSDVAGVEVTFHITDSDDHSNRGQSSSFLDLDYHSVASPDVYVVRDVTMVTTTIDAVMGDHWADAPAGLVLSTDLQGVDLLALKGAVATLEKCEAVYLECNIEELYLGCGLLPEVEVFLNEHGFEVVELELAGCQFPDCRDRGNRYVGWGDLLARRVPRPHLFREKRPDLWEAWYGKPKKPAVTRAERVNARNARARQAARRRR